MGFQILFPPLKRFVFSHALLQQALGIVHFCWSCSDFADFTLLYRSPLIRASPLLPNFSPTAGWRLSVKPAQSTPRRPEFERCLSRPSAPEPGLTGWLPRGKTMRRFVYCKVVLTTSLVWVLVDVFLLLYFSECNKCDERKDRSLLPALRGESASLLLQPPFPGSSRLIFWHEWMNEWTNDCMSV